MQFHGRNNRSRVAIVVPVAAALAQFIDDFSTQSDAEFAFQEARSIIFGSTTVFLKSSSGKRTGIAFPAYWPLLPLVIALPNSISKPVKPNRFLIPSVTISFIPYFSYARLEQVVAHPSRPNTFILLLLLWYAFKYCSCARITSPCCLSGIRLTIHHIVRSARTLSYCSLIMSSLSRRDRIANCPFEDLLKKQQQK